MRNVKINNDPANNRSNYGVFFIDGGNKLILEKNVEINGLDARALNIRKNATAIMGEGCKITGITAENNAYYSYDGYTGTANAGAAVYICPGGTFEMSGGEISGNYSAAGGAVYAENGGTFKVSGDAKIKGNYTNASETTQADVYLGNYSGKLSTVTVTGALTGEIGVYTQTTPGASNPVLAIAVGGKNAEGEDYTVTENDAKCFASNKPTTAGIRLSKDEDGLTTTSIVLAVDARIKNFVVEGVTGPEIDEKGYDELSEAITKAGTNGTVRMTDPSAITENQNGTLPNGVTLVDGNGNSFKGTGEGTGVTVEAKTGKVTVSSGSATVTPAEGGSATVGVQGASDATTHDVTVSGTATVTAGENGKVDFGSSKSDVTIDGITYSGKTSYDLDDPFALGEGDSSVTATVPRGKSLNVDETNSVTVTGDTGGAVTVTKSKDGGEEKTTVDVPTGSSVTVGGKSYTGPVKFEMGETGLEPTPVDLYVSATGNNSNPGTLELPFATLNQAVTKAIGSAGGANIYILSDLTLTSGVTFNSDKKFTVKSLTADGEDTDTPWTIIRSTSFTNKAMITVTTGDVTFENVTFDGGSFTVQLAQQGGILEQTGGTVTLGKGTTLRNSYNLSDTSYSPGGVRVCGASAVLNMENGAVIQNNQANVDGGGLIVQRGTVNISGGEICYNTSQSYAAGIYATTTVAGNGNHISGYVSVINITGGKIHDNFMKSTSGGGGAGILIAIQGQVIMTGGEVTHNGAAAKSGSSAGITIWENTTGVGGVTVGGTAVIRDNYIGATRNDDGTVNYANGTESNIYLAKKSGNVAKSLTISGEKALESGAYIGISVQSPTGSGSEVIATGASDLSSSARYFHSDNSDFVVRPMKDQNTKLVLGTAVYLVWKNDVPTYYDKWEDVAKELDDDGEKTVYLVGKPNPADTVDLSGGITLIEDKSGDTYTKGTGAEGDSKITVNTDGSISVPATESENSVTLKPGSNSKGATVNGHNVTGPEGEEIVITVTKGEEGATAKATAKNAGSGEDKGVIIDGVTFTGGKDNTYDVADPFKDASASDSGITASVPDGRTVTVPDGVEGGKGFTVTNPANSDGDNIEVTVPKDGTDGVKGTVTSENGGKVSVQAGDNAAVTYELGAKGTLNLKNDSTEGGKGDYIELASGSVTVPNGGALTANGTDMTVSRGSVTATKGKPGENDVTVTVPSGSTLTVEGKPYSGATTVVFHSDGTYEEVLPDYYVDETLAENGDGSKERPYNTFSAAWSAANSTVKGAKIHLLSDANAGSATLTVNKGKDITIIGEKGEDEKGQATLNFTQKPSQDNGFVKLNAVLTLDNVILDGNNNTAITLYGGFSFYNNSGLVMNKGAVIQNFTTDGRSYSGLSDMGGYFFYRMSDTDQATMKFHMNEGSEIRSCAGNSSTLIYLNITDVVIKGAKFTNLRNSSVLSATKAVIEDTEFSGNAGYDFSAWSSGALNIRGQINAQKAGIGRNSEYGNYDYYFNVDGLDETQEHPIPVTPGTDITCQKFAVNAASRDLVEAFKLDLDNYSLVYCDGEKDYLYDAETGRFIQVLLPLKSSIKGVGDSEKAGHDEHEANTLWIVRNDLYKIAQVFVGGEVTDASFPKGTAENPYTSIDEMLEDTTFMRSVDKRGLTVVMGEDLDITADQMTELMDKTVLTFTSGEVAESDKETHPNGRYGLTVKKGDGDEARTGVTVGTGKNLTFDNVDVKAGSDITGDMFTVDGGILTMEDVTLTGKDGARGVNVKSGSVTLKDTEIKGFKAAESDTYGGKGSGVYVGGGDVTLGGKVNIKNNGDSSSNNSNVYLATNQTLTADGMTEGSKVGLDTADDFSSLSSRTAVKGAQSGDIQFFKSDMSNHGLFYQNGTVAFGPNGESKSYYVHPNGVDWDGQNGSIAGATGEVGSATNPINPAAMDKVSGTLVEFLIMADITLPKSTNTDGSDSSNYGMRIVSSQFRIVSVYNAGTEEAPNWVQVTDANDPNIHTITRGDIPNGAPMFWNVGIGGIEIAYVKIADAKENPTHGPVVRAHDDDKSNKCTGNILLTGVTITGDYNYEANGRNYGTAGTVIDFKSNGGTLTLTDTTVTGLKVGTNGAVYVGADATVIVDGSTKITDNKSGETVKNVNLPENKTVTIGADFNGKVGVTVANGKEETPVAQIDGKADCSAYARYFSSDNAKFIVKANADKTQLVLGTGIYQVGDEFFNSFEDAKAAAEKTEDKTVHLIGTPAEETKADLGPDITLVDDATGDKYTGGNVSVDKDGKVTVVGVSRTTFTPGEAGNKATVKYGDKTSEVSTPDGKDVEIDVNVGTSSASAGTGNSEDEFIIDGVTYSGASSGMYDLGTPLNGNDVTATVPKGEDVTIPGASGASVENSSTGNSYIEVKSHGANGTPYRAELSLDSNEAATVKKNADDKTGTKYTGKQDGTTLGIDSAGDATLTAGSVGVPKDGAVKVNGTTVTNNDADEIVVTKDQPSTGFAQVEIPDGSTVKVGDQKFTGPMTVVIDPNGNASFYEGTVTLKHNDSVKAGFSDGKTVDVTNKGTAGDVTVTRPSANDENKGSAAVPNGGQVSIGGKTYDATASGAVFDFDSTGNVDITAGGTKLSDGETVGFGSVELGNKETESATDDGITVEVKGDEATVTVPKGETFTVKGADGKEHTYKNNGTGELELTVDKNGNVSVDTLPSGGLDLGPDTPITVTDPTGGNDNPLIAGKNGATLKPNTSHEDGETANNPPLLADGSIIFPEEGGSSMVAVPQGEGADKAEKRLDGNNVEITVGEDGNITAKSAEDGVAGQVTVEGGTKYTLPADPSQEATLNKDGAFGAPAKGEIEGNKDGPGTHPYLLVPDTENNKNNNVGLYTVVQDENDQDTGSESVVQMDPGAAFDIHTKVAGGDGKTPAEPSLGHYEGAGNGAQVTVDHEKGSVTLDDGSVHIGGNKAPEGTAVDTPLVVDGQTVTSSDATVTKSGGEGTGADVTVPAGGSFTVKGEKEDGSDDKTYTVPEDGKDPTTFHVNPDGTVELTDGSAALGNDDTVNVGDVTFGGSTGTDGKDKTTVTVPSPNGEGETRVEVETGGSVTVTAGEPKAEKKYENGDDKTELVLDVDKDGNVTLETGSVTLPDDGGKVDFTLNGDEDDKHTVTGDGVTVSKDASNSSEAKVEVENTEGTSGKDVTIDDTTYTVPKESDAEFKVGGEKGPELTGGTVELDAKGEPTPAKNESVSVNGATVEATGDGKTGDDTGKKVTVTKDEKTGTGKVTIPDGGSANVNGVEVKGPAEVEIAETGTAKVTPKPAGEGKTVTVGGIDYTDTKDDEKTGSVTITPDGSVSSTDMTPTVKGETDKPVFVGPGQSVTFEDETTGKKTTVTGGMTGGWIMTDDEGNLTLTDETGAADHGKFSNAGETELTLTVNGDTAELTGGTVHVDGGDSITVNGNGYTAGSGGMTMTYTASTDPEGAAAVPELTDGTVKPAVDAPVKVGDNTYTPVTDNVEVGMGTGETTKNGSVKSTDGSEAKVKFDNKGDGANEKEYLLPGSTATEPVEPDADNTKLPSPAQEKLTNTSSTDLGSTADGAKIKGGTNNGEGGNGDAYLESKENSHSLTLEPGASAEVTDMDGKTTATYENTGDADAHLTLDNNGNATLEDGTVKMTGGTEPDTEASVKVGGNTVTSKDATVTAPGVDASGNEGGADVKVPANGEFTVKGTPDKTYKGGATGETTFHVNPDGTVTLKEGTVELGKDDSVGFGSTEITGSNKSDATPAVTVTAPAATGSDNAKVEVESGNDVKIGDKTYTNDGSDKLTLEVTPEGDAELKDGSVKLPENGGKVGVNVTEQGVGSEDYTVEGSGVTVDKNKNDPKQATVTVPSNGTSGAKNTVTVGDNTYTNEGTGELQVELTPDGPVLAEGKAGLGDKSELGVGTNDGKVIPVESTGNGTDGEQVTVEKKSDGTTVVEIPDGGSAKVNGVEVKGPAKVTIDGEGNATVEPEVPETKVTVGGVEYTDDPATASEGKVTIKPDGYVDATGMNGKIPEGTELPITDLHIPANGTLTYKAGNEDVKLRGGANGATVDIDRDGNVTGKAGNVTVKGNVDAEVGENAKEGTQVHQVGDVTVKVTDRTGKPVPQANVTVTVTVTDESGKTRTYTGVTDADGEAVIEDVPYGVHSVVVEKGDYTCTGSVTVDEKNNDLTGSAFVFDAEFKVNTTVSSNLDRKPSVENLHNVADEHADDVKDGVSVQVDIELKANTLTSNAQTSQIKSEIDEAAEAQGTVTDYVDMTVTKTVTTTEVGGKTETTHETVTDTPLLTITFPIPANLAEKLGDKLEDADDYIFLYRQHSSEDGVSSITKMDKVTKSYGERLNSECYYAYKLGGNWYITVKAEKFSVYAFGVLETPEAPANGSGGSTGFGGGTDSGNVKIPSVENGTVTVTPKNAKAGETVTITPTPDFGYETGSVTVTDKNGNTVEVTDNGDGTYSFVMPEASAQPVTVNVTFVKARSAAERFEDIYGTEWYAEYVEYVVAHGLMNGMSPTLFRPNVITNRGMIVTILYRLEGKPAVTKNIPFEDVKPGMYYTDAVIWAEQNGIITGYNEREYGPEDPVTREQAAAILGRYARYKGHDITATNDLSGFTDADKISLYAVEFMKWAVENKIIEGTSPTTLDPTSGSTRAMIAAILTRYCKEIEEK